MQDPVGLWAQLEYRDRLGGWLGEARLCIAPCAHWVHRTQLWASQAGKGLTPEDLHTQWHHMPLTLQPSLGVPGHWGGSFGPGEGSSHNLELWSSSSMPLPWTSSIVLPAQVHPSFQLVPRASITQGLQSPSLSYPTARLLQASSDWWRQHGELIC